MGDRETVRLALHHAAAWQETLMDAYSNDRASPEYAKAVRRRDQYRGLLLKRYGEDLAAREQEGNNSPTVSIFDIPLPEPR